MKTALSLDAIKPGKGIAREQNLMLTLNEFLTASVIDVYSIIDHFQKPMLEH